MEKSHLPSPRSQRKAAHVTAGAALLGLVALLANDPDSAHAALREAAGGANAGDGGFARLGSFMDKITTYLIWLAAPCAGLGVVAGGVMLIAGNPRASRVLGLVAVGFAVIVTAKGLVA